MTLSRLISACQPGARHVSHTPAACSFPGENARSWEAPAPESIRGPSLPLLTCSLPTLPPVSPGEVGSSESFVLLLSWALPSKATGGPSLVCLHGLCSYCSSALTSCLNGPPERPGWLFIGITITSSVKAHLWDPSVIRTCGKKSPWPRVRTCWSWAVGFTSSHHEQNRV